jgi:phosphopantetheine adenylyltransferase
MEFDEMPKKSYIEIIQEMKERFTNYYDLLINIQKEIISLKKIKENANKQGAVNIEEKVDILLYNMNWEEKQLNMNRRVFFHRLKALNLIDDDN